MADAGTKMTHAELCERARKWLASAGKCPIVLVEFTALLGEIPDAIGFRNSGLDALLVECKASRADFLADRLKPHRRIDKAEKALGNYRWYMCEPDVIRVEELPAGWGLLWVTGNQVEVVHGYDPRRVAWPTDEWRTKTSSNECVLMYSMLRRLQLSLGAKAFREHSTRRLMRVEANAAKAEAPANDREGQ